MAQPAPARACIVGPACTLLLYGLIPTNHRSRWMFGLRVISASNDTTLVDDWTPQGAVLMQMLMQMVNATQSYNDSIECDVVANCTDLLAAPSHARSPPPTVIMITTCPTPVSNTPQGPRAHYRSPATDSRTAER